MQAMPDTGGAGSAIIDRWLTSFHIDVGPQASHMGCQEGQITLPTAAMARAIQPGLSGTRERIA
jgi:hypothetical protein